VVEPSAAGLAALVLFVLVVGFWVPSRVRRRSELAAARVDDRFSDGLRVLAVAGTTQSMPGGHSAGWRSADIMLDAGATGVTYSEGVTAMAAERFETHERAVRRGDVVASHPDAPRGARGGVDNTGDVGVRIPAARRSYLAKRARRARRRLGLTIALLLATAGTWAAVYWTILLWYAGLAPSVLLTLVLVLGRVASAQARRADAAWWESVRAADEPQAQPAARAATAATGERRGIPATAREAAPGIRAGGQDARATARAPLPERIVPASRDRAIPAADYDAGAARRDGADTRHREDTVAARHDSAATTRRDGAATVDAPDASPSPNGLWMPEPIPLPTYATKPMAPRWEPVPLTGVASASNPDGGAAAATETSWSLRATQDAALAGARPEPEEALAAAEDAEPDDPSRPQTLGLPLSQILARRRAAG
jgi:hypothetical protein